MLEVQSVFLKHDDHTLPCIELPYPAGAEAGPTPAMTSVAGKMIFIGPGSVPATALGDGKTCHYPAVM
jgi:hypothetical protein